VAEGRTSLPALIVIKFVLNVLLVWLLSSQLQTIFALQGGLTAIVTVGALLTLMNLVVRPVLTIVTLPFKLFASVLVTVAVNGVFLWLTERIIGNMDPAVVSLSINGGLLSWFVVAFTFGFANWLIKASLK
jgi:putative membrane protein